MQIDAIYDNGRLKFARPVRFARNRFRVRVEIPEQEIIEPNERAVEAELSVFGDEWLTRLEAIKQEVLRIAEEDLPELTEKQQERMRAFALREDR